jgi:hypothetical protein
MLVGLLKQAIFELVPYGTFTSVSSQYKYKYTFNIVMSGIAYVFWT